MSRTRLALFAALPFVVLACSGSNNRTGFGEDSSPTGPADGATPAPTGGFDNQGPPDDAGPPKEIAEVFGHSPDTLYRLDPETKAVTVVGKFKGCSYVQDLALDADSTVFATTQDALYKIDRTTAECTQIASGSYPNSLSFVPKGTLDANDETLVGYVKTAYVRIDKTTGQKTTIGQLGTKFGKGLQSSGDVVSVEGGATYLTVNGGSCEANDCLVEIDPKTGAITKNWGSIEHKDVFGVAFWAGSLYGFDNSGKLFEVTFGTKQLATKELPIPSKPSGLKFWGAGSTTSAPLVPTPK